MAKGYLQDYMSKKPKIGNSGSTLSSRIANAKTRISDVGEEKDTRNWLEKTLNLKEDQNALFDIAEILGRPQQALFGAIKAKQEGANVGKTALDGLTGEDYTYGGELLRNAGMKDSEGIGADDLAGFALDIFADPMSVAAIPAKGAKGLKFISGSEVAGKAIKSGVKGAIKATDFGIESGLKVSDAMRGIKYTDEFSKSADKLGKIVDDKTFNQVGKLESYKKLKSQVGSAFNYRKSAPVDAVSRIAKKTEEAEFAKQISLKKLQQVDDMIKSEAIMQKKSFKQLDAEYKALAQAESMKKGYSVREMILSNKKKAFNLASPADVKTVADKLTELKVPFTVKDNTIRIGAIPKELKVQKQLVDSLDNIMVNKDLTGQSDFLSYVDELSKDEQLMNFYKANPHSKQYADINEVFKNRTGYDMTDYLSKQDYDRATILERKRATGKPVTFGSKSSEENIFTRNTKVQQGTKRLEKQLDAKIEKLTENLSENRIARLNDTIEKVGEVEAKFKSAYAKAMGKRGAKTKKLYNKIAKNEYKRQAVIEMFSDSMIKKYKKLLPGTDTDSIIKTSMKMQKDVTKFNELNKMLVNDGLTVKKVDSIINQMVTIDSKMDNYATALNGTLEQISKKVTDVGNSAIKKAVNHGEHMSTNAVKTYALKEKLATTKNINKVISNRIKDGISRRTEELKYLTDKLDNLEGQDLLKQDAIIRDQINNLNKEKALLSTKEVDKLFTESFTETFGDYINQTTEYIKGKTILNEILISDTMRDDSLMRIVSKNNKDIPAGMISVDGNTIAKKMSDGWGKFVDQDAIDRFVGEIKGSNVLLDKQVHNLLFKTVNPKEANEFLKIIGNYNNMFKKLKTLSPGFQMRNAIGNPTNMWLSGMSPVAMPKYMNQAKNVWSKTDSVMEKMAIGAKLTAEESKTLEILEEFAESGLFKSGSKVMDLDEILAVNGKSENIAKQAYDKVFEMNAKWNSSIDAQYRMTLFLYAKENPKYLELHNAKSAGEVVRKVLFDPNDLSDFEKNVMRKLVPFYTFTKQNLFFQIDNLTRNPVKYQRLIKTNNAVWDGQFDEDEYMQWQKQGFNLPLPINDSNGNPLMFKLNLPLSDVGEYFDNPLQKGLSSLTPAVRAPFEKVAGVELFTGRDLDNVSNLDFIAKNTGLDLFTKQVGKVGQLGGMENAGDVISTLAPSVASPLDTDKNITSNQYQELDELSAYIKKLKEAGVAVRDVDKIKETAKQRLARLERQRKKNSLY